MNVCQVFLKNLLEILNTFSVRQIFRYIRMLLCKHAKKKTSRVIINIKGLKH